MKVGEIWKHKNKQRLLESDFYCYEDGDEKVKIEDLINDERVCFSHLKSGAYGVLYREHFIKSYEKAHDENR